jgi:hypothetical protein
MPRPSASRFASAALCAGVLPFLIAREAECVQPRAQTPAPPIAESPAVDTRESARREAERRLRQAAIPIPMTKERFASILGSIDPALAASEELASGFASYATQAASLADAAAARIAGRLAAAYVFDAARETYFPRPNPELVDVLSVRNKCLAQLAALERGLFRAIQLAAPPERRLRIADAHLGWLEERLDPVDKLGKDGNDGLLPSTKLTLLEIVARSALSPESTAAVEPTLVAHAEKLIALREARLAALREGELGRARIESEAGTLWRYGPMNSVTATDAMLATIDDEEFRTETAIRDLHFESLRRLRGQLPSDAGRRVVEQWQRSVHPELFDDERIVATVVRTLIALPASDPAGDAASDEVLLDLVETAYRRLEPLGRDAARAADGILPRLVDRSAVGRIAEIEARLDVLAIQAKRRSVLREFVTRVQSGVSAEATDARAQVTLLAESLTALERADAFDRASLTALAGALRAAIEAEASAGGETEIAAPAGPASERAPASSEGSGSSTGDDGGARGGRDVRSQRQESQGGRNGRGSRRQNPRRSTTNRRLSSARH